MPDVTLSLSESEEGRVRELIDALRVPVTVNWEKAGFVNEEFISEFQSRLLAQHVFLGAPLLQNNFDKAYIASVEAAGFQVTEALDGQRFWDVQVGDKRLSLKSTGAKSLKVGKLHISKLTEAVWIQDCRNAKQRWQFTRQLFEEYCEAVSEIVQFRFFRNSNRYELVGLSVDVLKQVLDLPVSVFAADGPSINIPIGNEVPDFTLKLDRSDAKITIANINKDICKVYAQWDLPSLETGA